MSKRYREFLLDIITKTYQIILAIVIITPLITKKFDVLQLALGVFVALVLIFWGGVISAKMEG